MILVIDNYDSFTYNLVQYFEELGEDVIVRRNNKITLKEIKELNPERIVISPGPGTPKEAGISNEIISSFMYKIPILGVCLGHQCLAYVLGGKIVQAKQIIHGKTSIIYHDNRTIFKGIRNPFEATRYHSLIVEKSSLPSSLEVTAYTPDQEIMGLRLKQGYAEGIQFHPESILTKVGKKILKNFLELKFDKRKDKKC